MHPHFRRVPSASHGFTMSTSDPLLTVQKIDVLPRFLAKCNFIRRPPPSFSTVFPLYIFNTHPLFL